MQVPVYYLCYNLKQMTVVSTPSAVIKSHVLLAACFVRPSRLSHCKIREVIIEGLWTESFRKANIRHEVVPIDFAPPTFLLHSHETQRL